LQVAELTSSSEVETQMMKKLSLHSHLFISGATACFCVYSLSVSFLLLYLAFCLSLVWVMASGSLREWRKLYPMLVLTKIDLGIDNLS